MKKKLFVIGVFLVFAACAFFISGGDWKIDAQAKEKAEILEKTAGYKNWKEIFKTGGKKAETNPVLSVADSSGYG